METKVEPTDIDLNRQTLCIEPFVCILILWVPYPKEDGASDV